ncbi:MAG: TonB family protein [Alphaproteobacteria bacterium]
MALLNHYPSAPQPPMGGAAVVAVVGHVIILVLMSLAITSSIHMAKPMMMQVRIVGVPTPSQAPSKPVEPEEVRTQDSAAPKEPPPETKNIPPSEAKTKFLQKVEELDKKEKPNPMDAKKRPPVLDKNPNEKKIVKNDLKAKVVKNPEDYMAALDFIDKLKTEQITPSPTAAAKPSDKPAGEGAQIQLDASEMGMVDGIRSHIEDNWLRPSGLDTKDLSAVVLVEVDAEGTVKSRKIIESSGKDFYDQSLLRAVQKASPLPIPRDKYEVFKTLELHFAG